MVNRTSDEMFMREAIALSRKGFPAPNPHVGCVIVKGGMIVGRGYHHHAGGGHAEAKALASAGANARGSTAYVTLEPCNHFGRTPPCSHALLQEGVVRVVYALPDPNPQAMGGGEFLRTQGVIVEQGLMATEAALANRQFMFAMSHRRPLIVAKAAAGMDGRIALPTGESKWITGPSSRTAAHRLRAELGAVLVGRRTVELDDPELTARIPGVVNQPLRIVLDPHGKLSGREKVFNDRAPSRHVIGNFDLGELMTELFEDGTTGLLVEGGSVTIGSFFTSNLVDRLELFIAPRLLGDGPSWLSNLSIVSLECGPRLKIDTIRRKGQDIQISAEVQNR